MYRNIKIGEGDYMEGDYCKQSDDDFWNENQVGHDFEENDPSSNLNQLSLATSEKTNAKKSEKCNVTYPETKPVSRQSDETSTSIVSNVELQDEDNIPLTLNLCIITPKQKFKEIEKTSYYGAIKNAVMGMECDLNPFKTLLEKQKLLKAANFFHDGNTILMVVLFMRRTLKKSIFQREIMMYPDAVNMYLSYLQEGHQTHELEDMLLLLRRPMDAAILKYENANLIRDPKRKLNVLVNLRNTYCESGTLDRFFTSSVLEHCMCIEDYKVLMDHKVVSDTCDESVFEAVIRRKEITDSCAMHALVFSILHFYNVAEIANISPSTIKARYRIPARKFHWCTLVTLAAAQSYHNIERMFIVKKWLGGTKIQCYVPYQTVLDILYRSQAPLEVMEKFCDAIDSQAEKLSFAQKYHCNSLVIEILKKKRSRMSFLEFQNTLSPDSMDYKIISAILNSADIKWKP